MYTLLLLCDVNFFQASFKATEFSFKSLLLFQRFAGLILNQTDPDCDGFNLDLYLTDTSCQNVI